MPFSISAHLTAGPPRTALLLSCSLLFKCASEKKKNMIRRMSALWIWEAKPYWHIKDFRMGKLELFWSVTAASGVCVCVCFFVVVVFFLITMCEGWMWVGCQFIFVTDTRTGKLSAWITEDRKTDIDVKFDSGGRTMAKRKGLLFPLLYFMAEFWLTSQQVLRIGKNVFFFFLCYSYQLFMYRLLLNTQLFYIM